MLTNCCKMPTLGIRCSGCGHRQTVNGVKPKQTRDIAKRNPGFVITELRGRAKAKAYGRQLQRSGQLSTQQFG